MEDAVTKLSQRLFNVVVTRLLEKLDLVLSLQYFFCQFQTTSSSIVACEESEHKFIRIVGMMDILSTSMTIRTHLLH